MWLFKNWDAPIITIRGWRRKNGYHVRGAVLVLLGSESRSAFLFNKQMSVYEPCSDHTHLPNIVSVRVRGRQVLPLTVFFLFVLLGSVVAESCSGQLGINQSEAKIESLEHHGLKPCPPCQCWTCVKAHCVQQNQEMLVRWFSTSCFRSSLFCSHQSDTHSLPT